MKDVDKTIEVIKAAMEKEEREKHSKASKDEKTDELSDDIEAASRKECQKDKDIPYQKDKDAVKDTDDKDKKETSQDEAAPSKTGKALPRSSKSKELAAKEEKIMELNDRLMRSMAEFDNYRKRTEKEKAQMFDMGVMSTIEKILPIIDNFERGLSSVNEADKDSPLVQGFNMIYKQLMTTLEEIGVKAIEAVGKEFNPDYHNAVMHGEDEKLGENIISEEYQKGYMYRDIVVRHSMVKVVN